MRGATAIGSQVGWLGRQSGESHQIAHPLPSTPWTFTAAILAHIPTDVTVIWSTGDNGLPDGDPTDESAADLVKHTLSSSALMKQGSREVYLGVVANGGAGQVPDSLANGIVTNDEAGHPVSVTLAGGERGVLIIEVAQRGSTTPLPVSEANLKAIADDPLVGAQTDARTLTRSTSIPSFKVRPPAMSRSAV